MSNGDKFAALTEIATELIVKELTRRAKASGMTTEELIAGASANFDKATEEADALLAQE